jgi:hypothetical protein
MMSEDVAEVGIDFRFPVGNAPIEPDQIAIGDKKSGMPVPSRWFQRSRSWK